jgi:hypothetical protein
MKKRKGRHAFADVFFRLILQPPSVLETGCWGWKGSFTADGYSRFSLSGRYQKVHQMLYKYFIGTVEDGKELDHLCKNRWCCNPYHLESVTHRENVLRGDSPPAICARKIACPAGHPYCDSNTSVRSDGARHCRVCDRLRKRDVRQGKGKASRPWRWKQTSDDLEGAVGVVSGE